MADSRPRTPDQPIRPTISRSKLLHGLRDRVLNRGSGSLLQSPRVKEHSSTASPSNRMSSQDHPPSPAVATPPISSNPFQPRSFPSPSPTQVPSWQGPPRQQTPPLSDGALPVCFAVDVSGSTQGRVLRREQDAISEISDVLTNKGRYSKTESSILPWDSRALPNLPLEGALDLRSGAGTTPWVILDDPHHKESLQKAGLWFLMTDGYIYESDVRSFANAIPEAGIHGTACVIITFGYYHRSPFECNVSVGMSVFAVAPHCLFLYHAVEDNKVYVFQAKGCFDDLMPFIVTFDNSTRWDDLHQISYDELVSIEIPPPINLSQEAVMLPTGREFDMRSIYENTISEEDKRELLSDYASLDVILLAANTRGTSHLVKSWLETSREENEVTAPETLDREDFGGLGVFHLKELITRVTESEDPDTFWDSVRSNCGEDDITLVPMKKKIRELHQVNWKRFRERVEDENQRSSKMNEAFDNILTTMSHVEINSCVPSPALLTPMSTRRVAFQAQSHRIPSIDNSGRQAESSQASRGVYSSSVIPVPMSGMVDEDETLDLDTSPMTFLAGFEAFEPSEYDDEFLPKSYGTCLICGREKSIQTLLLQSNSTTEPTASLPEPNQRWGHKYPLVLGNYAETDIVLPLVTCDGCAFLLQTAGNLPDGAGTVTAALPLVPLSLYENRSKWIEVLSEVYGHRFSEPIVLPVFLSTLCSTIEDLSECDDSGAVAVRECLEWCCDQILSVPDSPALIGLKPIEGPMSDSDSAVSEEYADTVRETITEAFLVTYDTDPVKVSPLLMYPIHGLVSLVRLAATFQLVETSHIEGVVQNKFCYHIVGQHAEMQARVGVEVANDKLKSLLFEPCSTSDTNSSPSARSVCRVVDLVNTHLLSQEALEQFRRMDDFFSPMESEGSSFPYVLALVLHVMNKIVSKETTVADPVSCFGRLQILADTLTQKSNGGQDASESPKPMDEEKAKLLIQRCRELDD